jgi:putative DNA primase/helicase
MNNHSSSSKTNTPGLTRMSDLLKDWKPTPAPDTPVAGANANASPNPRPGPTAMATPSPKPPTTGTPAATASPAIDSRPIETVDFVAESGEKNHAIMKLPDPEPWPEPVDGAALFNELRQLIGRFVVLPQWAGETLALWIVHTYAFQLRDVSTYIGLESPEKRCGKTTLLTVLSELVNRPVVASNISSPAFFRVIEEVRPTLLIDEADTFLQGNDELRGILNSGYSRSTAYVVRVSHQAGNSEIRIATGREPISQLARYSCWCPKVMAAIGRLPDTLADRCIVVRMKRKTSNEQCDRFKGVNTTDLRRKCARLVKDHREAIIRAHPEIPSKLNDRAADVWEPLLVLSDLAGGEWPELARQAAVGLSTIMPDNSPIGSLLFDICYLFSTWKVEKVFSKTLVRGLNLLPDRPWADDRQGRAMDDVWLAQMVRPYGIQPRQFRHGDYRARGYAATEFFDALRRYVPPSELPSWAREYKPASEKDNTSTPTQPPLNAAA